MQEQKILAFCVDLRGYKQALAQDPEQLAKILQIFVSYIHEIVSPLPQLAQTSIQGDAYIGVCEFENDCEQITILATLHELAKQYARFAATCRDAQLPQLQFGIGIEGGVSLKTQTVISSPHGDLYVGRVISQAMKFADYAMRPEAPYPIVIGQALQAFEQQPAAQVVFGQEPRWYYQAK